MNQRGPEVGELAESTLRHAAMMLTCWRKCVEPGPGVVDRSEKVHPVAERRAELGDVLGVDQRHHRGVRLDAAHHSARAAVNRIGCPLAGRPPQYKLPGRGWAGRSRCPARTRYRASYRRW